MEKHQLIVAKRKITGRKVKSLRAKGVLPANVFGKKVKSLSLQVGKDDLAKIYAKAGETGLVELKLGDETRPVLIHNLQVDPVTSEPLHVDFFQVDLKEKVTAKVPVEALGEAPAEKQGLGTVVTQLDEIEVEALPGDLPDKFEVNLEMLAEVDQAIHVKDLKVDKAKVKILTNADEIVVKVEPLQKVEEVAPPAAEVPAEGVEAVAGAETTPAVPETGKEAPAPQEKKEETAK